MAEAEGRALGSVALDVMTDGIIDVSELGDGVERRVTSPCISRGIVGVLIPPLPPQLDAGVILPGIVVCGAKAPIGVVGGIAIITLVSVPP